MEQDFRELEAVLDFSFDNEQHLELALTHSSFINERQGDAESNERLEFLGDAVLELVVSEELFKRFPDEREGHLTRLRARLVKEPSLAEMARKIGLPGFLLLGKGEESQGGRNRDALLADAFEALLGAIFLDAGFERTKQCVLHLLEGHWPNSPDLPRTKDFKTRLQEACQLHHKERPVYSQIDVYGPDHAKIYLVRVELPNGQAYEAEGGSKKKAEQNAAHRALTAVYGEDQTSP